MKVLLFLPMLHFYLRVRWALDDSSTPTAASSSEDDLLRALVFSFIIITA